MAVIKADWPHTAASDTGTARSTAMRQSVTICNPHPAAIHTFTGDVLLFIFQCPR